MRTSIRLRPYTIVTLSVVAIATRPVTPLVAQGSAPLANHDKQRMTFKSGDLTLVGYSFKPEGAGPFPLVIWNHGSEPDPGNSPQFDSAAAIAGRLHQDLIKSTVASQGFPAAAHLMVRLMGSEQSDDQLAMPTYAKTLNWVDGSKTVVAGCSHGIETLLGAERGAGFNAAFSISPVALSWQSSTVLQDRLKEAVRRINIPVRLTQPPKDASLEPPAYSAPKPNAQGRVRASR
jgi:dienelactone hydrolase